MSRVTLRDVARESHVSVSLVSKILRGENVPVAAKTAASVQEAARRIGYIGNRQARQLKTGKSMMIGVFSTIGTDFAATVYPNLMEGIARVGSEENCAYDFVFFATYKDYKEYESLKAMLSIDPDGILYMAPPKYPGTPHADEHRNLLKSVADSGKPILFLMERYDIDNTCAFLFDDKKGGYTAAKYLINQGKRRIMHCRSPFDDRLSGYLAAMQEAGLSINGLITDTMGFFFEDGYRFFNDYFQTHAPDAFPEGILATSDVQASGILQAMQENGISPERIPVVGYDGLGIMRLGGRNFPTVVQPVLQIAEDGARAMIQWIETGNRPENRQYAPTIKHTFTL